MSSSNTNSKGQILHPRHLIEDTSPVGTHGHAEDIEGFAVENQRPSAFLIFASILIVVGTVPVPSPRENSKLRPTPQGLCLLL